MNLKGKIETWYWRHWEAFDLIESIVMSKEVKFLSTALLSMFGLVLVSKTFIEFEFDLSLMGNHPLVDIWFLSIMIGFGFGVLMMSLLERR